MILFCFVATGVQPSYMPYSDRDITTFHILLILLYNRISTSRNFLLCFNGSEMPIHALYWWQHYQNLGISQKVLQQGCCIKWYLEQVWSAYAYVKITMALSKSKLLCKSNTTRLLHVVLSVSFSCAKSSTHVLYWSRNCLISVIFDIPKQRCCANRSFVH